MNKKASEYRESRIGIISFLASENSQREFASKVYYKSYSEEFYCWWFDEWPPEGQLWSEAFTSQEIERLNIFSAVWQEMDNGLQDMGINELLSNESWQCVISQASLVIAEISNAT